MNLALFFPVADVVAGPMIAIALLPILLIIAVVIVAAAFLIWAIVRRRKRK